MRINNSTRYTLIILAISLLFGSLLTAQQQNPMDIALRYLENNATAWNLSEDDISDIGVADLFLTKHNQVTHVYLLQRYNGIDVDRAMINVAVTKEGKAFTIGHRMIQNLASKIVASNAEFGATDAVVKAATHLGLQWEGTPTMKERTRKGVYIFEAGEYAKQAIHVKQNYVLHEDGRVYLAWNVLFDVAKSDDYWNLQLNARDGSILQQSNFTVSCTFEEGQYHNHDAACRDANAHKAATPSIAVDEALNSLNMTGTYRVFAFPSESPNHGPHELLTDPANSIASPYGWHDVNGSDGAEYTITRGNNVHAFLDWDDIDVSSGDEPDGGVDLNFDFPYVDNVEPDSNRNAAVVNLFYALNAVHDFAYRYGFDEAGGNFQQNNYGNGGIGGDYINANAQDGFNTGNTNNANYSGGPDGSNGRIQMFAWTSGSGNRLLHVNAPSSISGSYETSTTAGWGMAITETDTVRGEVAIVNDGTSDPYITDGCEDADNTAELAGKIALIDRGGCEFGLKCLKAEEAGAIGVIICNFEDAYVNMGAGAVGAQVSIPAIFINVVDCATIRQFAGSGLEVTLKVKPTVGPDFLDGDFDNGIIAHEMGHGISNRMVGGPSSTGCLGAESGSEGISDLMALIMTVKPGDTGDMRRGVGTFALGEDPDGRGIRRYPYSTDMNINPLTYGDVAGSNGVHAIGEIYCTVMWDLHWAFVDKYGFDADLANGNGGNNTFVQLFFDGMKLAPCVPGYLDYRDAILLADTLNNGAENACMIWEVFARRGMGYFAVQGDGGSSTDQIEDFEPLPVCVGDLRVAKSVTPLVNAGDDIEVTVKINNYKADAVTNVVITDELPNGVSYLAGSIGGGYTATASGGMLTIEIGEMATQEELEFTYTLTTDENRFSIERWKDPAETGDFWFPRPTTSPDPGNNWEVTNIDSYTGSNCWAIPIVEVTSRQQLIMIDPIPINGNNPVLRFYHRYDTRNGVDAGIIEVTTDDDPLDGVWERVDEKFIRNGYPIPVAYGTFIIPNISGYSGNSGDWVGSYLDLSDYAGEDVFIRFNFAIDGDVAPDGQSHTGWFVDDIEVMNMVNYNGELCISSDEGDMACTIAPENGTIVESQIGVAVKDPVDKSVQMNIFPNPANEQLSIYIASDAQKDATLSLMSLDGRELISKAIVLNTNAETHVMNLRNVAAGFYFVKVNTAQGVKVEKVVIR